MKRKPDVSKFHLSKDPDDFLNGAIADKAEKKQSKVEVKKTETQQKIFRLPVDVINALKLHVAHQQVETGQKISETKIVEKLLREYLKL
ncbi:hypothetical protein [Zymomonas mobilis]|nr:hypothetical protein [Zymomonas mobilis]